MEATEEAMNELLGGVAPASAKSAPPGDLVKDTTTKTFTADVLEESKRQPVLVDFWAPWCGPCRTLSPVIEKAVKAAKGAVRLVKMNIDDHPAVASQLGIQSIPAVIAFVAGRAVDGFVGAMPESQVKAFIDRLVAEHGPEPAAANPDEIVAEGNRVLAEGNAAGAAAIFGRALAVAPQSVPALAGLARTQIAAGDLDAARQTLAAIPETSTDPAAAGARAELRLAGEVAALPDETTLQARLAANPADHQARFDLALLRNARGDRAGATDALLEIVAKDRNWQEQKARKQLVEFFSAWGPTDEATLAGRRRLSSLLFA
jgi:putative thioredoxin